MCWLTGTDRCWFSLMGPVCRSPAWRVKVLFCTRSKDVCVSVQRPLDSGERRRDSDLIQMNCSRVGRRSGYLVIPSGSLIGHISLRDRLLARSRTRGRTYTRTTPTLTRR